MRKCQRFMIYFLASVAILVVSLVVMFAIFMITFDPFRTPPLMNQEQVIACFEINYESLAIVAAYLENVEHYDLDVRHFPGRTYIFKHHDVRREAADISSEVVVTNPQVVRAIEQLDREGYRIWRFHNRISFQRDATSKFSNHGRSRTGVFYLFDGNCPDSVPLSRPNWYFYLCYSPAS